MNEFTKPNACTNFPQFIAENRNSNESCILNSTTISNNTKDIRFTIHHRKSRSIDVKMGQIYETNQERNSIEEISERKENYITSKNNLTSHPINQSTNIHDKKIFPEFHSNKLNNGYQTERKDETNIYTDTLGDWCIKNRNINSRNSSNNNNNNKPFNTKNRKSCSNNKNNNKSFVSRNNLSYYSSIQSAQKKIIAKIPATKKLRSQNNSIEKERQNNLSKSPFLKIQMSNGSKIQPKTLDRLECMYKKGLEKFEKNRKLHEEITIKRKIEEVAECTFQPKLNKIDALNHISRLKQDKISIHERHKIWSEKKHEKIQKEKLTSKIKEQRECTFVPDVTKKQVEYFDYDVKNDKNVKKYLQRIENAKKIKNELNEKIHPDYNERYDKLVRSKYIRPPKINDSNINTDVMISQYTSLNPNAEVKLTYDTAIKNLHSRLHSIELLDENII